MAITKIFEFSSGPIENMNFDGKGKVKLNISGKFKDIKLNGQINVSNTKVTYKGLSKPAFVPESTVKFKNDDVIFDNVTGQVENTKVIANGSITLDGFSDVKLSFPKLDLNMAHDIVFRSPLLDDVKNVLQDLTSISGNADTLIHLKGTKEDLKADGDLYFTNATAKYTGFAEPFTNLKGHLRFDDKQVIFDKITGQIAKSPAMADGAIIGSAKLKNQRIKMTIISPKLNLYEARKFVKNSQLLELTEKDLKNLSYINGFASINLKLLGNLQSGDIFQDVAFNINKAEFNYKNISFPIKLNSGGIYINKDTFYTNSVKGEALQSPIGISGNIKTIKNDKLVPNVQLSFSKFNFLKIKDLLRLPMVYKNLKFNIDLFKDFKGQANADISILPGSYNVKIKVDNVSALFEPMDLPLKLNRGTINLSPDKISFEPLYAEIGKTPVFLNGNYKDKNNKFNIAASLTLNSDDVNEFINPYLTYPIEIKGNIPVAASFKGTPEDWQLQSQITLNKNDELSYKTMIDLPTDKIRVLSLKAAGNKDEVNVENLELSVADDAIAVGTSASSIPKSATTLDKYLIAQGKITNISDENPKFTDFKVKIPGTLSVKMLNPLISDDKKPFFTQGNLAGDVTLNGELSAPKIIGNLTLNNITIPSKNLNLNYANILFNKEETVIKDSNLNFAGSPMHIQAAIDNIYDLPIVIRKIKINSPALNIDNVAQVFKVQKSSQTQGQIPTASQTDSGMPPFIIIDGELKAKELVINNLITTDILSGFNFTPDWLLSMPDLTFHTAGGTALGEIYYNLKSSNLSANIEAKNMEANAAATTLLSLPNEVYGTLNGKTQFNSHGSNAKELITNSNGSADFKITNGRLVRLGSLEYLQELQM